MEIRFTTTPRLEELRDEVRTWLDEELPPEYEGFDWPWEEDPDRWAFMKQFWLGAGTNRWLEPSWPLEYGGAAMSPRQAQVVRDEFARRRAGGLAGIGGSVAAAIFRLGDAEQRAEFLPGVAAGEIMWAEGYTEPDAGSDLASLRTRAELDGDEWVINGVKTFCTAGHFMNWIIIATRTDPDVSKRSRGISYFLTPTDTPGIEFRPLYNIGYGRQNLVYLDDVRVPARHMLGDLNQGWSQVWFGQGGTPIPTFPDDDPGPEIECDPPPIKEFGSSTSFRFILDELIRYCQQTVRNGAPMSKDPVVRAELARLAMHIEAERVCQYEGGRRYGAHLNQAIFKEFWPDFAQTCMEIVGPLGQVTDGEWAPLLGEIDRNYRQSFSNHGGGTPQIKRMVVATRVLGLPAVIDFALDEDQQVVQASMHDFFSRRCPPAVVREVEAGDVGYVPELWQEIADLGWLGITIPEAYGGTGGTLVDLYGLYEEMGRALFPSPHLDTVVVAGTTLLTAGTDAQRDAVLPAIARGDCIVSLAVIEPNGGFGPGCITMRAEPRGAEWVLRGTKALVGFAPSADWFLCAVRTSGDLEEQGVTVFLVDSSTPGISWTYLPNIGGAALYAVEFDDVAVAASSVVGEVGNGWPALSDAMVRGAVLQTASIVGSGRRVLEMANQYAKDRVQFGKPIGSYQAVQYMVSDILLDLHRTDLLARHATYRIAAGMPCGEEAAVAIGFGKEAAAHMVRQAHEVHGGVAYIVDHDLTLYSLRSKYWENNLGDARYHLERLAVELAI